MRSSERLTLFYGLRAKHSFKILQIFFLWKSLCAMIELDCHIVVKHRWGQALSRWGQALSRSESFLHSIQTNEYLNSNRRCREGSWSHSFLLFHFSHSFIIFIVVSYIFTMSVLRAGERVARVYYSCGWPAEQNVRTGRDRLGRVFKSASTH